MTLRSQTSLIALILCVFSRLLTAIYYIEDPDSLRFALSTVDYDVANLQPHFPAYPVFCWLVKTIMLLVGGYAVAFAVVGGLMTWVIMMSLLAIARESLISRRGLVIAGLVFFNPMVWLMGNRYMPDVTGLACLLGSYYLLTNGRRPVLGGFLAGLLAGIRLSYLPFAVLPWVRAVWVSRLNRSQVLGASALGVIVWAVPLIGITGWSELVEAAHVQVAGHFVEFGGTVVTEPDWSTRFSKLSEGIVADGLGLYWTHRHIATALAGITLVVVVLPVLSGLVKEVIKDPFWRIQLASWGIYLLWVCFGQNVIHKSRHVLPLIPLLLLIIVGAAFIGTKARRIRQIAFVLFVTAHSYITLNLVAQHKRPSAIYQVKQHLADMNAPDLHVVTVPLIEYYLASQSVEATYIVIEGGDLSQLDQIPTGSLVVSIGSPLDFSDRQLKARKTFYHNPYVNRMWPEIEIYEY